MVTPTHKQLIHTLSQNSHLSQEATKGDGMLLPHVQGHRNALLAKNYLESTWKFPTQSSMSNFL